MPGLGGKLDPAEGARQNRPQKDKAPRARGFEKVGFSGRPSLEPFGVITEISLDPSLPILAASASASAAAMSVKQNSHVRGQLALALDHATDHYHLLHSGQVGTVIVMQADRFSKSFIKFEPGMPRGELDEKLAQLDGQLDTYLSVAQFAGWRRSDLLRRLVANYVDLDLPAPLASEAAAQQHILYVMDELAGLGLPTPNAAVFSGRGLHLYWLLTPAASKALPVWQAIQDRLVKLLAPLGADPHARDCARVLRLVGSINSKSGLAARCFVLDGKPWTLHQLSDEVLGHRPPKPAARVQGLEVERAKRGRPGHSRGLARGPYARWYAVMKDLIVLAQAHGGQVPEGFRNVWLHLAATSLSWFGNPDTLAGQVLEFALEYAPGIPQSEALSCCVQALDRASAAARGEKVLWCGQEKDPRYHYSAARLWEVLGGLVTPAALPKLRAILPPGEKTKREQARKQALAVRLGRSRGEYTGTGVRASNSEKAAQATAMREQGASWREIAAALGVSQKTARNWVSGGVYQIAPVYTPPEGELDRPQAVALAGRKN